MRALPFGFGSHGPARNVSDAHITLNKPESAKLCTVVCVNKTDKPIDSLGLKCSGEMTLTDSDGQLLMMVSAGNFDYGLPVGLKPGERRSCFRLFGGGQLDSVTAIVGKASTPHILNEKLAVGRTLILNFQPDDKLTVERE